MDRKERLAIRLDDVDKLPPEVRVGLLAGRLDLDKILRVGQGERAEDIPAVEFTCPLLEAALVCDMVRSYNRKVGDSPSEVYLHRGNDQSRYVRVIYADTLTVVVAGKPALNPKLFPKDRIQVVDNREIAPLRRG